MGCKAKTTAIAQLWRGFATLQTAQNRADRAARDLFSVALDAASGQFIPAAAFGSVAAQKPAVDTRVAKCMHAPSAKQRELAASTWVRLFDGPHTLGATHASLLQTK